MDIPPLFLKWFARPTSIIQWGVIWGYSVHRHLHLLFPQLSWGIDTVSLSSFDTGKKTSRSEPERFYHGFVLGLMVELSEQYAVTSNRESGFESSIKTD
jgi:hypothetical protein